MNIYRTFIRSAAAASGPDAEAPLFAAGFPEEEEEASLVWPLLVAFLNNACLRSNRPVFDTDEVNAREPFSTVVCDITPLLSFERPPVRDTESLSTICLKHPDRLIGYTRN